MFWSAKKPFKSDSNDYVTNNQTSSGKSVLRNFQIRACWNQHSKPRKLIYIITSLIISNLGWLILFCVIYIRQFRRSWLQRQLLATLSLIINKKERMKKKKNRTRFITFLQAFIRNFRRISLNCVIYRTSIDHAQIN